MTETQIRHCPSCDRDKPEALFISAKEPRCGACSRKVWKDRRTVDNGLRWIDELPRHGSQEHDELEAAYNRLGQRLGVEP